MRILGPIVFAQTLLMANRQSQSSPGRSIGPKLVGHQQSGRKAVLLEQFAHEPPGCPGVAPPPHQQIKNFTLVGAGPFRALNPRRRFSDRPSNF
jgi:hypothetical protein